MRTAALTKLTIGLLLIAATAFAQTKPAFEVATIRPAEPLDQAKIIATVQSGGKLPVGNRIAAGRAEYLYADLKSLIATAYGVKPNQVTGPDWLVNTRFDILAKMPAGAAKNETPEMLQALLEERFRLVAHRASAEHPVLAIVAGKGAPRLKSSDQVPIPIDENSPLKPGERQIDSFHGPIRMTFNTATGTVVMNMGSKGRVIQQVDQAKQSVHLDFTMTTMAGFADMLTQLLSQSSGGTARQIVDMTGIKGSYDISLDLPLAELMNRLKSVGMDIPGAADETASDPGGMSSLTEVLQSLGLKLESRKAMADQIVVDKIEKTPTAN